MPRWSLLVAAIALAAVSAGCVAPRASGPARGQALFNSCAPCHGPAGEGLVEQQAPGIAGLPAWYVTAQLTSFRNGWRGYHAADVQGLRMRPMSLIPTDDADIAALSEYIAGLPIAPTTATVFGDINAGKALYATCGACHAAGGEGLEALKAPPLKDLPDWYLLSQLQKYKNGQRGKHPQDVQGALMQAGVGLLADEQAMKNVVAYIESL